MDNAPQPTPADEQRQRLEAQLNVLHGLLLSDSGCGQLRAHLATMDRQRAERLANLCRVLLIRVPELRPRLHALWAASGHAAAQPDAAAPQAQQAQQQPHQQRAVRRSRSAPLVLPSASAHRPRPARLAILSRALRRTCSDSGAEQAVSASNAAHQGQPQAPGASATRTQQHGLNRTASHTHAGQVSAQGAGATPEQAGARVDTTYAAPGRGDVCAHVTARAGRVDNLSATDHATHPHVLPSSVVALKCGRTVLRPAPASPPAAQCGADEQGGLYQLRNTSAFAVASDAAAAGAGARAQWYVAEGNPVQSQHGAYPATHAAQASQSLLWEPPSMESRWNVITPGVTAVHSLKTLHDSCTQHTSQLCLCTGSQHASCMHAASTHTLSLSHTHKHTRTHSPKVPVVAASH